VFPNADRFEFGRPNIGRSLAFGRGPHNCPGAGLGRLELRVALEELLARTESFELDGEIVPTRFPEIGALSVPLKFVARS
jgi:cytochrome P450